MRNIAFKLEDSGFSREQVDALTEFMSGSVATKEDMANLWSEVKGDIARLEGKIIALYGKINLVYWMLGILIACVSSLVIKTFWG